MLNYYYQRKFVLIELAFLGSTFRTKGWDSYPFKDDGD